MPVDPADPARSRHGPCCVRGMTPDLGETLWVVVRTEYEALARRQAAAFDGVEIVAQPLDRDTGPGVLLPLAQVLAHDPEARRAPAATRVMRRPEA